MTALSVEPTASSQIQPPRNKSVRDDVAPPREFGTLVDDTTPRPADPVHVRSGDRPERSQVANDRRDQNVKAGSDAPAPDNAAPVAAPESAPSATAGTAEFNAIAVTKLDTAKADISKPDDDSSAVTAPAVTLLDVPAVPIASLASQIVPQTPVMPIVAVTPTAVAEAGPLSIAASALAATAATLEAITPQKAKGDATATATTAATADPALADAASISNAWISKASISKTSISNAATKPATPAHEAGLDTTAELTAGDSAQSPVQPAGPNAAKTEAQPDARQATASADGAPPNILPAPAPHERHTATAATSAPDAAAQIVLPAVATTPTATTLPTALPQISVVASQTAPVPLNGLAMQIAATAIRGNTSFEIRLDPAELGRIDVRLDVDRHGNVTSHLTVEKPETLAMLRQDAPQLQRALTDAGLQTTDKGLQFSLSDQSPTGQNNNPNRGSDDNARAMQRLVIAEDDNSSIASAGRSYGRILASSSGVDIRI